MTQAKSGIEVKSLSSVSSLSPSASIMALTDAINNTVNLATLLTLAEALISTTANNGLSSDTNGLYVPNIGNLSQLTTQNKTSVVSAINENVSSISQNTQNITQISETLQGIGSQTIQDIQTLTSGTITLDKTKSIYIYTPSANTTFTFNLASGTVTSTQTFTFELYVNMSSSVYSLTFPTSLTWQGGNAPDTTSTGKYLFVFRTLDAGTTWIGNLQGTW